MIAEQSRQNDVSAQATSTLHIMHVCDTLGLGGAERMLVDIANATAADGNRASVCITRSNLTLAKTLRPDIPCFALERERRWDDLAAMRRMGQFVTRNGVDLIHCHGRTSFGFAAVARKLRLFRKPI